MRKSRRSPSLFRRSYLLFGIFFVLGGLIVARLATLQIINSENYKELALASQQFQENLTPRRGEIFAQDKNHTLTAYASNKQWENAYAVPELVPDSDKEQLAHDVSSALGLDFDTVLFRVSKTGDPYEPLKNKLSDSELTSFQSLEKTYKGLGTTTTWDRYYPFNDISAQLIGFLGYRGNTHTGQYGLEEHFNSILRGHSGTSSGEIDTFGHIIPFGPKDYSPAVNGDDLVLTVDPIISQEAQTVVSNLVKDYKAKSASIIVMDPRTGAIRAMETAPSFDPNNYSKVSSIGVYRNPIVSDAYEPGSIFKAVTMAAGLDLGDVTHSTKYTDPGIIYFGTLTIQNFDNRSHGIQTMTQVLENSLNTGAVFVEQRVGNDNFKHYLEAFGFGQLTGIDTNGEVTGTIKNLDSGRDVNFATASFGQGITVTPLQMVDAYAAIANKGKLMKPYVVDRIVKPDGSISITEPKVVRQVVSRETAATLTKMLVDVVNDGFDHKARVAGYAIAGKTGTAQIADPNGPGYLPDTYNHSFIGYGPADNPRFVVMIELDQPQGATYASNTVAPPFAKLARFLLNYYEIPPTQPTK